eukprot:g2943.t1
MLLPHSPRSSPEIMNEKKRSRTAATKFDNVCYVPCPGRDWGHGICDHHAVCDRLAADHYAGARMFLLTRELKEIWMQRKFFDSFIPEVVLKIALDFTGTTVRRYRHSHVRTCNKEKYETGVVFGRMKHCYYSKELGIYHKAGTYFPDNFAAHFRKQSAKLFYQNLVAGADSRAELGLGSGEVAGKVNMAKQKEKSQLQVRVGKAKKVYTYVWDENLFHYADNNDQLALEGLKFHLNRDKYRVRSLNTVLREVLLFSRKNIASPYQFFTDTYKWFFNPYAVHFQNPTLQTILGFFRHFLERHKLEYGETSDAEEMSQRGDLPELLGEDLEGQILQHTGIRRLILGDEEYNDAGGGTGTNVAIFGQKNLMLKQEVEKIWYSVLLRSALLRKSVNEDPLLTEDLEHSRSFLFRIFHGLFAPPSVDVEAKSHEREDKNAVVLTNPLLQYAFFYVRVDVNYTEHVKNSTVAEGEDEEIAEPEAETTRQHDSPGGAAGDESSANEDGQEQETPSLNFTVEELFERTCWMPCPTVDWEFLCHAFGICDAAAPSEGDGDARAHRGAADEQDVRDDEADTTGKMQQSALRTEMQREVVWSYNQWVIPDVRAKAPFHIENRGFGERYEAFSDHWEKTVGPAPPQQPAETAVVPPVGTDASASTMSTTTTVSASEARATSPEKTTAKTGAVGTSEPMRGAASARRSFGDEEQLATNKPPVSRNLEAAKRHFADHQSHSGKKNLEDVFSVAELMRMWQGNGEVWPMVVPDGRGGDPDHDHDLVSAGSADSVPLPLERFRERTTESRQRSQMSGAYRELEVQELESKKRAFRPMLSIGEVWNENSQSAQPEVACSSDFDKLSLEYKWSLDEFHPDSKNHYYKMPMQTVHTDRQSVTCIHPSLPELKNLLQQDSACRSYTWKKAWKKPLNRAYFKKQSCKFGWELDLLMPKVKESFKTGHQQPFPSGSAIDVENELPFLRDETARRYWGARTRASQVPHHPHVPRNLTITEVFTFLKNTMLPVVVGKNGLYLPRLEPAQLDTTIPGHQAGKALATFTLRTSKPITLSNLRERLIRDENLPLDGTEQLCKRKSDNTRFKPTWCSPEDEVELVLGFPDVAEWLSFLIQQLFEGDVGGVVTEIALAEVELLFCYQYGSDFGHSARALLGEHGATQLVDFLKSQEAYFEINAGSETVRSADGSSYRTASSMYSAGDKTETETSERRSTAGDVNLLEGVSSPEFSDRGGCETKWNLNAPVFLPSQYRPQHVVIGQADYATGTITAGLTAAQPDAHAAVALFELRHRATVCLESFLKVFEKHSGLHIEHIRRHGRLAHASRSTVAEHVTCHIRDLQNPHICLPMLYASVLAEGGRMERVCQKMSSVEKFHADDEALHFQLSLCRDLPLRLTIDFAKCYM